MIPEFEDALKKREHEFRIQTDEMSAKVLEYDLKVMVKHSGQIKHSSLFAQTRISTLTPQIITLARLFL